MWLLTVLLGAALFLLWWNRAPEPGKETARRIKREAAAFRRDDLVSRSARGCGRPAKKKADSSFRADPPPPAAGKNTPVKKPASPKRAFSEKKTKRTVYPVVAKYPPGTVVDLNTADTTVLKKVPGIGSVFALRIVKYRRLLGGFASVEQLREVYGIDEERYAALAGWFAAHPSQVVPLPVNRWPADSLRRHPYISFRQARAIERLRVQKGRLSGWHNLVLLEEFTEGDRKRLLPYLSFD